ncbi:MAG: nuclear transport factor 2 family protein [Ferruginibacter sp.]
MINPGKALIEKFYTAFQIADAETMVSCYHNDVVFCDPVFGELKGDDAKAMWRMLCTNAKDLKIEFGDINASLKKGSAHWEAWYSFSKTGRKVHNIVEAEFEFKDSKIVKHIDSFNLHKWASQAFGLKGWLLGGTKFFADKTHAQTQQTLLKYKEKMKSQAP